MATPRNLFERPDLLDNQTRLILSADAKPKRLVRSATRPVTGQHVLHERPDSVNSAFIIQETDDELLNDVIDANQDENRSAKKLTTETEDFNYDTDIEQEAEPQRDYTCKALYYEQCRRHGVIPSTLFLRHLNDEVMSIRYGGLKPINVKVMVQALKMNSTITKLDLRDNGLGSRGAVYVSQVLKDNEYIDELNLGDNDIGIHGNHFKKKTSNRNESFQH